MPNILIRGISGETKQRLEKRAAENGRSQNAEAAAILEKKPRPNPGVICQHNDATLVTHNTKDFEHFSIPLLDPFDYES